MGARVGRLLRHRCRLMSIAWPLALWLASTPTGVGAPAAAPPTAPWAPAESATATFIGHQVTMGTVFVPMFGEQDTRTDTRLLVTVREEGDTLHWQQRTCGVDMAPVAGVKSSLPKGTLPKLPVDDIRLQRGADGRWRGAWDTQWTEEDLDGDGRPGVSIRVDVPLCSGYVYVATKTRTRATVSRVGDMLLGEVQVTMEQRVLGASNFCLRLGPKRQEQRFDGVLKLVPAPRVADCSDAADTAWPTVM